MGRDIKKARERAEGVYYAKDRDELEANYDAWAEDFDEDAREAFGYCGPDLALDCIQRHLPTDARILDAGAGTGRLGQLLHDAGYTNLTGFDLSQGMLDVAARLGVYKALHRMALGERLDFDDGAFDATACIGTLTTGHAPPSGIDELIRITKPGGIIIVTLNLSTYEDDGVKARIEALEADEKWTLVEASDPLPLCPVAAPDIIHDARVYRVL